MAQEIHVLKIVSYSFSAAYMFSFIESLGLLLIHVIDSKHNSETICASNTIEWSIYSFFYYLFSE